MFDAPENWTFLDANGDIFEPERNKIYTLSDFKLDVDAAGDMTVRVTAVEV
jgi:hypothetical protein